MIHLRDAILSGALRPGDVVPETALVAHYGVSRTTLRHALSTLGESGLVDLHPNRSPRVAEPHHSDAPGAIVTLGVLMRGVVQDATPDMSMSMRAEQLRGIERTIAACQTADLEVLAIDTVNGYHRWADACHNRVLAQTLHDQADALTFTVVATDSTVRQQVVLDELAALKNAVTIGDPRAAASAIAAMHSPDDVVSNRAVRFIRTAADAA